MRPWLAAFVVLFGCESRTSRPSGDHQAFTGAFPAIREDPAIAFTIELPKTYQLDERSPEFPQIPYLFHAADTFKPSFAIGRTHRAEPEHGIALYPQATVTRGDRGGRPWFIQVRKESSVTTTDASLVVPVGGELVQCKAYVATTDPTPIGDWMIARCATLAVRVE